MAPETNGSLSNKRQDIIKDISRLKDERSDLEQNISDLNSQQTELTGSVSSLKTEKTELSGSVAELEEQISGHTETLGKLKSDIDAANKEIGLPDENGKFPESSLNGKKIKLNEDVKLHERLAKLRKAQIDKEVSIIENVQSFKKETVKNMQVYGWGMIATLALLIILVLFAVDSISDTITLFRNQIGNLPNGIMLRSTDWVISALSIVIIKLPITLLFIGGMFFVYKLFSSLFKVYEKINNEKRKISTIEALINQMNKESVSILNGEDIDYDNADSIQRAKDRIKWESISKYFESLPNDNLQNDTSIKAENDLFREIFLKSKNTVSVTTPVVSLTGSTETGK